MTLLDFFELLVLDIFFLKTISVCTIDISTNFISDSPLPSTEREQLFMEAIFHFMFFFNHVSQFNGYIGL